MPRCHPDTSVAPPESLGEDRQSSLWSLDSLALLTMSREVGTWVPDLVSFFSVATRKLKAKPEAQS